jgi:WD40 repeat protein
MNGMLTITLFSLSIHPDQKLLLSGRATPAQRPGIAGTIIHRQAEVVAHLYAINHLDFSPDGKHFVTCSMDKSIKVWDTEEIETAKVIDKPDMQGTELQSIKFCGPVITIRL